MTVRTRRARTAWRPARVGVLVVVCAALALGPAAPASAHGPTPDGTNYVGRVTAVVDPTDGTTRPPGAVTWQVHAADGLLQVTTTDGAEVVVEGYDDEPFLRVGPDGVFENRNSPATYLNLDRMANATVPADVDPAAAPRWRRVSDARQWRWHDHRIHWMAPTPPPEVRDQPGVGQRVLAWTVPFEVDGDSFEVRGVLDYVPPPRLWPWLLIAAVALSLPVIVSMALGVGEQRVRRTVVVLIIAVAGAAVAVAIGDAVATPTTLGANAWAVVQAVVPAAVAGALAWTAWRPERSGDAPRPGATLVVAALVVAVATGLSRLSQLTSSQVVNALPAEAVRAVVAASLMLAVPALLATRAAQRVADDA